tara:strand:- start:12 stop:908 length:897 start_codon:yes stop_codon:yes gene_type:complete
MISCPLCENKVAARNALLLEGSRLVVCPVCHIYFMDPMTIPETTFYNNDYYDSWGVREKIIPEHVVCLKEKNMRLHLEEIRKIKPHGRVLEIGCAMGFFLKQARILGYEVVGVEVSREACDVARFFVGEENIHNEEFGEVKFEQESFDIIFLSDVIEHIPDPSRIFKEMNRVLKENGIIYMLTPDPEHWSRKLLGSNWVHFKDEHLIFYPRRTMKWIEKEHGLILKECSKVVKYSNLNYLQTQLDHFNFRILSKISLIIRKAFPKALNEFLVPISLGEIRYVLQKPAIYHKKHFDFFK